MTQSVERLAADAAFRERAGAVGASLPGEVPPLEAMLAHMRRFSTARRREVRVNRLKSASRAGAAKWQSFRAGLPEAIAAFNAGVQALSELAQTLRPLINPALDNVMALAADEDHPLHRALHQTGKSFGLADDEIEWALDELAAIDYKPVHLVCTDGFEDIVALLNGVSAGELGLLLAGFIRFTGDIETDARLQKIVARLRSAGVTASVLLVLFIVATAHFVATYGRDAPFATA